MSYERAANLYDLFDRKENIDEVCQGGELLERLEECGRTGIIHRGRLHHLLAQAGFDVTQELGDYDFTNFREGSSLLIVEAHKRDTSE